MMRGCWIWLLTCACLVPASCAPEGASAKSSEVRIERITGLESTQVAGVGVQFPGSGERFLYVREDGAWRCVNALDAVALDGALDGLVADLTAATGTSREVADARLGAFGFAEDSPEVTLFGADWRTQQDRDELARFTLGAEVEGRRSYLRVVGAHAVFEVDRLPARRFERAEGDRLPPMLDRRMLAGEWPDATGGFTRAFLDFTGGKSVELARVGDATTYAWELRVPGAEALAVLPYRMAGWQSFLYRTPYAGFAAQAEAERVGLREVWLTITLVDAAGSIVLEVGELNADRPVAVRNRKTGMLVLLAPENAALLVPSEADLLDRGRANRWESWLGGAAVRR
ncbi:MAG: hypothetical protein H6831_14375 [Planctomycetes bacterium]|nr:hypothetical protein [Planctomycetota bacterium]MCB9905588.1 hypothetical protein [Planctomycetota bacterium]